VASRTTTAATDALVVAKLTVPVQRTGSVVRTALLTRLLAAEHQPVVSVSAPGGYGKTTLLAQWASRDARPFAWVAVDADDNDSVLLGRCVEDALRRAGVVGAPRNRRPVDTLGAAEILTRLRRLVATASRPFVLVLDDVHELSSDGSERLLGALARSLPDGSQLVLSGRGEAWFLVAAARAEGRVVEIGVNDLALSADEGRSLLAAVQPDAPPDEADRYVTRAEGWAAGLYLMALARQGGEPELSAADRSVEDYLWSQHLAALPGETLTFLRLTSVLERMCGDLCDAALERTGSARLLDTLEQANLFVIPLDRERRWYRYHDLFRGVLRRELERDDPESAAAVRRRAAEWCREYGDPGRAMRYAVEVGDADAMARIFVEKAFPMFRSGRLPTLAEWMAPFEDGDLLGRYPGVAVLGSIAHAFLGHPFQSERWLQVGVIATEGHADGESGRQLEGAVHAASAFLCRQGPARMREDASAALDLLPPFSPLRPPVMLLYATSLVLEGDPAAVTALEEAVDAADSAHATFALLGALALLALLVLDDGDLDEARRLRDRFHDSLDDEAYVGYNALALPVAVSAYVAVAEGQRDEAERLLTLAQRIRPSLSYALPQFAVLPLVVMARAYLQLGDAVAARAVLVDATDVLRHRPDVGIYGPEVERLRQRAASAPTADSGWELSLTAAELRLLPLLTTHLSFREIGERLFVSRNTVKTQAISIYRKLGASSRAEAVDRAAELGLIDGGALR
jgi:LuxR family transcriptional regulator, maltose regulon positive regulatory protein